METMINMGIRFFLVEYSSAYVWEVIIIYLQHYFSEKRVSEFQMISQQMHFWNTAISHPGDVLMFTCTIISVTITLTYPVWFFCKV